MRPPSLGSWLIVLALAFSLGCHREESSSSSETVVWRGIREVPTRLLAEVRTGIFLELDSWVAEVSDGRWRSDGEKPLQDTDVGVSWSPADGGLLVGVDFPTDGANLVDLQGEIPKAGLPVLFWRGSSERFSLDRRVVGRLLDGGKIARFELPSNRWQGQVTEFRFQIAGLGPRTLVQITGVRVGRLPAQPIDQAAAWLVDRSGDTRAALVQPLGMPLRWRLEVPRQARLRFGYGRSQAPGDHRVRLIASVGSDRSVLFQKVLKTSDPLWQVHEIELSEFAGMDVTIDAEAEGVREGTTGEVYWAHPEVFAPSRDPLPPVILISIDTLRADRLSLSGYPNPTTPHLDAWAARSATIFENAIASSPWTLPSHVSMLTGLDAHHHGVNRAFPAPTELETLAERLRSRGYSTVAVTGGAYLHPRYGLAQGFDRFRYWESAMAADELSTGVDQALELLRERNGDSTFLFLHTYAVHAPYRPRQPWFGNFSDLRDDFLVRDQLTGSYHEERRVPMASFVAAPVGGVQSPGFGPLPEELSRLPSDTYDAGVAYADDQIGRLLDGMDSMGFLDDALIVLTSDHGELLGEHGLAGHYYLYEENLKIPLIIDLPGTSDVRSRVPRQVSHPDLVPTILAALGLELPVPTDGRNLLPLILDRGAKIPTGVAWSYAAHGNHGLSMRVENRLKLIVRDSSWQTFRGFEELYALDRDPTEENNLALRTETNARLRERLEQEWEERSAGVRLRFENRGDRQIRGLLSSTSLSFDGVKSMNLRCNCLSFVENEGVRWVLPSRTSYTVLLLGESSKSDLSVRLGSKSNRAQTLPVGLEAGSKQGTTIVLIDGHWRFGSPEDGAVSITAWSPRAAAALVEPMEENEELDRQLRALGYLP